MRGVAVLGLLLAATWAPTASGLLGSRDGITTGIYHEGDLWRVEGTIHTVGANIDDRMPTSQRLHIVGRGATEDAYGVRRDVVEVRMDVHDDGALVHALRCHMLEGGTQAVHTQILNPSERTGPTSDFPLAPQVGPLGRQQMAKAEDWALPCFVEVALSGVTLHEGDTLPADHFVPRTHRQGGGTSLPAVATTFHGRRALDFTFEDLHTNADIGTWTFTVADGLPGIVRTRANITMAAPDWWWREHVLEMVAFDAGDGPPVVDAGARLPPRHPEAGAVPAERLRYDFSPFGLAFGFDEALAAIRAEPATGFADWLAGSPDLVLVDARWNREYELGGPSAPIDGYWELYIQNATVQRVYSAYRVGTGRDALPPAIKPVVAELRAEMPAVPDVELPPAIADSGVTVATLASMAGPLDGVYSIALAYHRYPGQAPYYTLGVGTQRSMPGAADEGVIAFANAVTGGRHALWPVVRAGALSVVPVAAAQLPTVTGAPDAMVASATSSIVAQGIVLLALLMVGAACWLLFTRHRRETILDHPVRAALHAQVLATPGMHQAELARAADVPPSAARYHLAHLVRANVVVAIPDGGFVRYHVAGAMPPAAARQHGVLRSEAARRVYEHFAAHPASSLREAADALGVSAPSVHRMRRKLVKAGVLPAPQVEDAGAPTGT